MKISAWTKKSFINYFSSASQTILRCIHCVQCCTLNKKKENRDKKKMLLFLQYISV